MNTLLSQERWDARVQNQLKYDRLEELPIHTAPKAFSRLPSEHPKDDIMMGFEWEVGYGGTSTEYLKQVLNLPIKDHINFAYGGQPLEMRAIPATMAYHRDVMQREFFGRNLHKKFTSVSCCGIHVHIAKAAFTATSLRKFISFVVLPENNAFVSGIGGRPINPGVDWCQPNRCVFKYARTKTPPVAGQLRRIVGCNLPLNEKLQAIHQEGVRYQPSGKSAAVNTWTAYPTVEFRIFKSQLTEQEFMKNLEFTDALVRYCRKSYNKLYVDDFVKYLLEQPEGTYQYLLKDPTVVAAVTKIIAEGWTPKAKIVEVKLTARSKGVSHAKILYKTLKEKIVKRFAKRSQVQS